MKIFRSFAVAVLIGCGYAAACAPRWLSDTEMVCVCNATFCDVPGVPSAPAAGSVLLVSSSMAGDRFEEQTLQFGDSAAGVTVNLTLSLNRTARFQSIFGFGGAMTDAAGINIAALSEAARENLISAYYSPEGLHYNMARVPVAGTDFSTHTYSYDDVDNDTALEFFSLSEEDFLYKIPYLLRAQELSDRELLIVSAAWSAPKWMKTNYDFAGEGKLIAEYWQLWADYLLRFVEEYATRGLPIWVMSAQNEPTDGNSDFSFNCMGWSAEEQRDWVGQNLGPTLATVQAQDPPAVLVIDDQRTMLDRWPQEILVDDAVMQYTQFVGVHWYTDLYTEASMLDVVHELSPETNILYTEACNGVQQIGEEPVILGSWERGEAYATDIIQVLNHWSTGWVDWNLALDLEGGPNWADNYVDSSVIVNATADEFYKQPSFYALGHFSRFIDPGSVRVQLDAGGADIDDMAVALETPDGQTVIVLHNTSEEPLNVLLSEPTLGDLQLELPARSLHTLLYSIE